MFTSYQCTDGFQHAEPTGRVEKKAGVLSSYLKRCSTNNTRISLDLLQKKAIRLNSDQNIYNTEQPQSIAMPCFTSAMKFSESLVFVAHLHHVSAYITVLSNCLL